MTAVDCRYLVVGGGLAGGRAAEALVRRSGPGEVLLVGSEPVLPSRRPMVSKELLLGGDEVDPWLHPESFWHDRGVSLHLDVRAVALDPERRRVRLDTGEHVSFGQLLICTGANPVPLRVPGDQLGGICYVRTLADAARLRAQLRSGQRCVIVGAGSVGCEVAAACRARGVEVPSSTRRPGPPVRPSSATRSVRGSPAFTGDTASTSAWRPRSGSSAVTGGCGRW